MIDRLFDTGIILGIRIVRNAGKRLRSGCLRERIAGRNGLLLKLIAACGCIPKLSFGKSQNICGMILSPMIPTQLGSIILILVQDHAWKQILIVIMHVFFIKMKMLLVYVVVNGIEVEVEVEGYS